MVYIIHDDGFKYEGTPTPNDDGTFDFDLDAYLVYNTVVDNIPYPQHFTQDNVYASGIFMLLNRIRVNLEDLHFTPDFKDLKNTLRSFLKTLTFRRVYKVKKTESFGEPTLFGWEDGKMVSRKCTHKDIENIPTSNNKNHQKNQELIYRKRYILEKGAYYGFTNKRGLRGNDRYNDSTIYFNPKGYHELNFLEDGDLRWYRPDNDSVYSIPYSGDLICGIVKDGRYGPFFDSWFLCSEQFFKMATIILESEHETVEKNMTALNRRLRTNNFERWLDETECVDDEEAREKFHRPRYEDMWNYKYIYSWLGIIMGKGSCNVPEYENGVEFLNVLSQTLVC